MCQDIDADPLSPIFPSVICIHMHVCTYTNVIYMYIPIHTYDIYVYINVFHSRLPPSGRPTAAVQTSTDPYATSRQAHRPMHTDLSIETVRRGGVAAADCRLQIT